AVPSPLHASPEDQAWLDTHWGWDIGAEALTRELVERKSCVALLGRFSRLVCDANRAPDDPTLIRREVEGHVLSFNRGIDDAEVARRIARYHAPYHELVDSCLAERVARGGDVVLFSVHSFTPVFAGQRREMEMGVLFDRYEAIAHRFASHLRDVGFRTALNAPYSGKDGMMYAMHRHGQTHGVAYLELEVRQDLLQEPAAIRDVADRVCAALTALQVREMDRAAL
ncbi:MAG: N-formylglutamate amidohydrolase, partial [Myxococcota bacterium]|nr:N-formylglutamate amidohydrolase [Myxococcota bacterium]